MASGDVPQARMRSSRSRSCIRAIVRESSAYGYRGSSSSARSRWARTPSVVRATSSRSSERLRGLEGVAQLADAPSARSDGSIVPADVGDATLRDLLKPLAVEELLARDPRRL